MVRLVPGRLVLLRTDGRADFIVAVRGRETVDFGLTVDDFGLAEVALAAVLGLATEVALTVVRLAAARGLAAVVALTVVRFTAVLGLVTLGLATLGFVVDALGLAAARSLAAAFRTGLAAARRTVVGATGLIVDMVLAAAVSALAAVAIDFVAVFMDRIADDMVFADVVALVAAAVILVAADVTLVAADVTLFAAVAGDAPPLAELRLAMLRVERDAIERPLALRAGRDVVLLADREAGFLVVDEAVPAFLMATVCVLFGVALLMVLAFVFGRLAVPDALRLTDLLRAVLAELRRVAARVVVLTGTEFSPRLDQLRWCYSTRGMCLHTQRLFPEDNEPQAIRNRRVR